MAIMTNCCGRGSLKSGCIAIGAALFVFCFVFDLITIGIVAGFPTIDTKFLDANLMRYNDSASGAARQELIRLNLLFEGRIRPVWRQQFVSLFCFLPWYALVNVCLIIGAIKEIGLFLLLWIAFTIGFQIWSFTLVGVMFAWDTSPDFVGGVSIAQLCSFAIFSGFLLVVFSLYQEIREKKIKEVVSKRDDYLNTSNN